MSRKPSRKRRQSWELQVKLMNEAKAEKRRQNSEELEEQHSTIDMNESDLLPAPTDTFPDVLSDEWSTDDEDYDEEEDVSAMYDDWMNELDREDLQMMAMMMYDYFVRQLKFMKTRTAEEVAKCLGISDRTVRAWRKDFLSNHRSFKERRGKYARYDALDDEEYRDMALEWVHNNAYVKGKPNMTAEDFCSWVNLNLLPQVLENHASAPSKITARTARRWLHKLGFEKVSSKKGIYIDGHERADVVEYRKVYLKKLDILASTHLPPPLCNDEPSSHAPVPSSSNEPSPCRNLVLIFHDESIFHSNDDQGWMWGEKGKIILKPKGQGRGIMVSDFIDEHNGYLALTDAEYEQGKQTYPDLQQQARKLLKYGAEFEGYWNSDKFLEQVEAAIKIAKVKYASDQFNVLWFFDHSSGHTAFAEDALNASRMNVKPGGKQPIMHDTVYNGKSQRMVLRDGTPKGMKLVLQERGVDVSGMKAEDMRLALQQMHDFKYEKTKLESLLATNGYRGFFIPKFHCELNPIERVWAQSKKYSRAHCDYSFKGLEGTIIPALDSVTLDSIRKFFRKMRDYINAYKEGLTAGPELEKAVKKYKSHRKVYEHQ